MSLHDHSGHHDQSQGGFLTSRTGLVLIGFVVIAGALLFTEHRAHVLGALIYAADRRPFDGRLSEEIRNVAVGRRPAIGWPGAFEEFSVPLTALRKELFGLVAADNTQSALAEACLIKIEKLRDRHGRIDDEPRHPDIESGRAWPKEASGTA
jgi:hypothetical protein